MYRWPGMSNEGTDAESPPVDFSLERLQELYKDAVRLQEAKIEELATKASLEVAREWATQIDKSRAGEDWADARVLRNYLRKIHGV